MEELLSHFQTKLSAITRNIGTEEEPVMDTVLKEVQTDDGQIANKVTLQLPAAYYDITKMDYSQTGEFVGIADVDVTIKLAVRKTDSQRWNTMNLINKALAGTGGNTFSGLAKKSHVRTEYDDIYVYTLVYTCALIDTSGMETKQLIENLEGRLTFDIN